MREVARGEKRKAQEMAGKSKYMDCLFIMGSAACVETLWSEADALMDKRRQALSPINFEMILFLKKNKDLWGLDEVIQANRNSLKRDKESRAEKKMEEAEPHCWCYSRFKIVYQ
jgi:hypothetical protein